MVLKWLLLKMGIYHFRKLGFKWNFFQILVKIFLILQVLQVLEFKPLMTSDFLPFKCVSYCFSFSRKLCCCVIICGSEMTQIHFLWTFMGIFPYQLIILSGIYNIYCGPHLHHHLPALFYTAGQFYIWHICYPYCLFLSLSFNNICI